MGGTYAGNAVSCAAGIAVQDAFRDEKILDNVAERSDEIFQTLRDLQNDPTYGDSIAEVRGLGLMVGIEFKSPTDPYTPSNGNTGKKVPENMAARVQNKCLEQGMLTLTTSVFQTIRSVLLAPSFAFALHPADSRSSRLTDSSLLLTSRRRTWTRVAPSSVKPSLTSSTRAKLRTRPLSLPPFRKR